MYWMVKVIAVNIILMALATKAFAIEVVVATGVNTDPPYVYGDNDINEDYPGITIDILKAIEEKTDITFIIKKMPWKRVVESVKEDVIDGGFHFSFKQKRKSFVAYPILKGERKPDPEFSISNRSYALYGLKGLYLDWNGQEILSHKRDDLLVGVIRGSSVNERIRSMGHQIKEVSHDIQLPLMLLKGRVDAFVALDNMLDAKINTLASAQQTKIVKISPAIENKAYYIAFAKGFYKKHPKVAWKIWRLISEFKENGTLDKLYEKYAEVRE